jgi:hypothetical protein
MKRHRSSLDIAIITELDEIFKYKKWHTHSNYDTFFESYCTFLENLEQVERSLIIELTKYYEWITFNKYMDFLSRGLEKLADHSYLNLKKVYVAPLITKRDKEAGKNKSSNLVSYLCKDVQFKSYKAFSDTNFIVADKIEYLPKETKINGGKYPVILVDDFVGTGETAEQALDELFDEYDYENELVFVITLVAQEEGIKHIHQRGFNIEAGLIRNKGISDNFYGQEALNRIAIMQLLENKLEVEEDHKLGYKGSEALITLIRTPNNTFPVYWLKKKTRQGKFWKPPFVRD